MGWKSRTPGGGHLEPAPGAGGALQSSLCLVPSGWTLRGETEAPPMPHLILVSLPQPLQDSERPPGKVAPWGPCCPAQLPFSSSLNHIFILIRVSLPPREKGRLLFSVITSLSLPPSLPTLPRCLFHTGQPLSLFSHLPPSCHLFTD